MRQLSIDEIEIAVYGANGIYERTVKKIEEIGVKEAVKKTGKKRQYIDIFKRQFNFPEKFDYRPQLNTIKEMAELLGVE